MKERPILFSAPMVHAILAGTKTQTRRVVKPTPPPGAHLHNITCQSGYRYAADPALILPAFDPNQGRVRWDCPYGQPGDRLWVREAWQAELRWDWTAPRDIKRGSPIYFEFGDEAVPACAGKKRPSIHMPRWASRITLEVTSVRVERLQDISEDDAYAEGVKHSEHGGITARDGFRRLWESINGAGSWDTNPWVWVVEFKRTEGEKT